MSGLGLNQATCDHVPTEEFLQASAAAGFGGVSLWRHKVDEGAHARIRTQAADLGLAITSLCRGGFFTADRADEQIEEDNRRAIEEAAALGAELLVLVCGPAVDGDIPSALSRIREGIAGLLDDAADAGVGLAVEPFHPMFAAERSALITLRQANDLLDELGHDALSIAIDTYHLWWDPDLDTELRRATGRISVVQVADWLVPTTSLLRGRGLPGDGVIRLAELLEAVSATGFHGWYEVEVLNAALDEEPALPLSRRARDSLATVLGREGAGS